MNFDIENTRRALIARRLAAGADTPDGHTCSNLAEMLPGVADYVRPEWAADERQTLPWMVRQQMKRLAPRTVQ